MSDLDLQINGILAEQAALANPLSRLRGQFQEELARFAAEWLTARTSETVKSQAEITVRLGQQQVTAMKQDLAQLIASVPDLVEQEFGQPKYWFHLQPAKEGQGQCYRITDDGVLDSTTFGDNYGNSSGNLAYGLAIILGNVAPLLKKYGYINGQNEREFLDREGSRRPQFIANVELSSAAGDALREYGKLVALHRRLSQDLAKVERQKLMAQAEEMWER